MIIEVYIDYIIRDEPQGRSKRSDSFYVEISPESFKSLDPAIDSVVSNMKMDILSYVYKNYPSV